MDRICSVDFDSAYYLGNEDDGVYFDAAKAPDGKWYWSAVVDCNSGGFTDSLTTDEGPYDTYEEACHAAMRTACDWCFTNDVQDEDEPIDDQCDGLSQAFSLDAAFVR